MLDDRGISEVMGLVLLLAITVALSATTLWMMDMRPPDPTEHLGSSEDVVVNTSPYDATATQTLNVQHLSGSAVDVQSLDVQVSYGGTTTTITPTGNDLDDGTWNPGDTMSIPLTNNGICATNNEELTLTVVNENDGSSIITKDVPVNTNLEFAIVNNKQIQTNQSYRANVTILSTDLSGYGSGYVYTGPVTMTVLVGDTVVTPWGDDNATDNPAPIEDDVNDPTGPEVHTYQTGLIDSNQSFSVQATSWFGRYYDDTGEYTTVNGRQYEYLRPTSVYSKRVQVNSNETDESNVVLLRDGESVPDFSEAGAEQRGVAEVLGDRIDDTGQLQLAQNEVVALFELSEQNADPSDASGSGDPDYNDAIALIQLQSPQQVTDGVTNESSSQVIVCPNK